MRTFGVSVVNGKVWCDTEQVRVKRGSVKEFDVRLDHNFADDYELRITVKDDPGDCLSMERKSSKFVRLIDDNQTPGQIKFGIELVPLPNSGAKPVTALDPIIDND